MGLKGAIRGIGTALTYAGQQGMEEQRQARRDAVIADREAAMVKLRAQLGEQSADADLTRKKALVTYSTNEEVRGKASELAAAAPYKRDEARTKMAIDDAKAEADFRRQIKQLEIQHGYKISEAQIESGLQQTREAAARGERVVAEGVDADGNVTVVYANNRTTRMVGLKPKPRGDDDDSILSTPQTGRGGRPVLTRRPSGKPAAPSTERVVELDVDMTRLAREYGAATPQTHPGLFRDGKKIPLEEAKRMIAASHGR